MILGGGEIYKHLLKKTDKIYLTKVHHTFLEADTFFPVLKEDEWKTVSTEKHTADEKHRYDFDFVVLERIK